MQPYPQSQQPSLQHYSQQQQQQHLNTMNNGPNAFNYSSAYMQQPGVNGPAVSASIQPATFPPSFAHHLPPPSQSHYASGYSAAAAYNPPPLPSLRQASYAPGPSTASSSSSSGTVPSATTASPVVSNVTYQQLSSGLSGSSGYANSNGQAAGYYPVPSNGGGSFTNGYSQPSSQSPTDAYPMPLRHINTNVMVPKQTQVQSHAPVKGAPVGQPAPLPARRLSLSSTGSAAQSMPYPPAGSAVPASPPAQSATPAAAIPDLPADRMHVTEFIMKMYNILEMRDYRNIVAWAEDGESFIVRDAAEFARSVLPRHFKHGNISSFVRQLNKYDFHKIRAEGSNNKGSVWQFQHAHFKRGRTELLPYVKRKVTQKKASISAAAARVPKETMEEDGMSLPDSPAPSHVHIVNGNIVDGGASVNGTYTTDPSASASTDQSQSKLAKTQRQVTDILLSMNKAIRSIATEVASMRSESIKRDDKMLKFLDAVIDGKTKEETTQLMSDFKSAIRSQQMQMFQFEEKLVQVVNTVGLQANALSASQTSFGSPLAGPVNNLSLLEMDEDEDEVSSTASDAAGPSMEPAISSNNQLTSKWAVPPRILLVEDDAICRRLSAKLLQIFGCTYDAVNDGVAAVNKMNLDKYDLVLMDIVMPNLDGVSATQRIRKFDPFTPIISVTSNTAEDDCITYLATGMNDILAKPFTKAGLFRMLERYCSHLAQRSNALEFNRSSSPVPRPMPLPIIGLGQDLQQSMFENMSTRSSGSGVMCFSNIFSELIRTPEPPGIPTGDFASIQELDSMSDLEKAFETVRSANEERTDKATSDAPAEQANDGPTAVSASKKTQA